MDFLIIHLRVYMSITLPNFEALASPAMPDGVMQDISLIQEKFPHIGIKIKQLPWGSAELQKFLTTIIFDERGGRQGFPNTIASALLRIYDVHSKLAPSTNEGDIWDLIIKRIGT